MNSPLREKKEVQEKVREGLTTPEKLSLFFGLTGPIGLIITIIYSVWGIWKGEPDIETGSIIVIQSLVVIFLVFISTYGIINTYKLQKEFGEFPYKVNALENEIKILERRLKYEQRLKSASARIFHNFGHEYRKRAVEIFEDIQTGDCSQIEDRRASLKQFFIYSLSNIKEIFDLITRDDCSVSIKLISEGVVFDKEINPEISDLIPEGLFGDKDFICNQNCYDANEKPIADKKYLKEVLLVETFLRDAISYRSRSNIDTILPQYPIYKNAAFSYILHPNYPYASYCSNDLKKEYGQGMYWNRRFDWEEHYNACLVVPIRSVKRTDKGEEGYYLGFVCVDNKLGSFELPIASDILSAFSDHFYHLFTLFDQLSSLATGGLAQNMKKQA